MPLSWNEIKARAIGFSKQWSGAESERADSQTFWNEFFQIFGLERRRVASFERQVQSTRAGHKIKNGRIDAFWKGVLLIEHKSAGQNLDRAFAQAVDYFDGLAERDLPRYVLVSDFTRMRLHDLEAPPGSEADFEFPTAELHKHIKRFAFIAGYQTQTIRPQDPVNLRAAEKMGALHDALKASGYTGHPLEVLLVRLLFCLFADDTGIFQPAQSFRAWLEERTAADGSDLGPQLAQLFQVLNTEEARRSTALDEQLRAFPYVNGKLFEEMLPLAAFNAAMREALLEACALDWSAISPAIFGAMFQSIMDGRARRNLGAHYTSEENILKLIKPLFLDELRAEFEKAKGNKNRLFEFHKKLRALAFLDPACGCGNFLVITYRELRALELDVLRAAYGSGQQVLDVHQLIALNVDQFHGIEIEEFPAQIAAVALWLIDHQMNLRISEEFGLYFARIPLKHSPHIVHGNALRIDWNEVLPAQRCNYVLGNPPFSGARVMAEGARRDLAAACDGVPNAGQLDLVCGWYVNAARYVLNAVGSDRPHSLHVAFVSTSSISQGEQVGVLWAWLLGQGMRIRFAHRSFAWSNEARGNAAVHCVIVGFGLGDTERPKIIYEYDDVRGEPHVLTAANINPYLVDAPSVLLPRRTRAICEVPEIAIGNKPIDGGWYLFSSIEKEQFLSTEPTAATWFRRWIGADEFINGYERWCLYLRDCPPQTLRTLPQVLQRIEAVRRFRLGAGPNARGKRSEKLPPESTRKLAETPTRFHVEFVPTASYLVLPQTSSENRRYMPIGFLDADTLTSNSMRVIPGGALFHFGVIQSLMHMAWMSTTTGRLESRYQYAAEVTYNNYPWPESPTDSQKTAIESAAQAVLDARAAFPTSTLADLYDPLTMPPLLVKAHQKLDAAVDAAYQQGLPAKRSFRTDAERVAFLFELYQRYTSLLPAEPATRRARRRASAASVPSPTTTDFS